MCDSGRVEPGHDGEGSELSAAGMRGPYLLFCSERSDEALSRKVRADMEIACPGQAGVPLRF
jgi:hypothetical protein